MNGWNYADLWEAVAEERPEATAQVSGLRRQTWRQFDRGADGIAQTLVSSGLGQQDKVALYLRNGTEYLETVFAVFKAGLVPVNTNYRYVERELEYLWDNADVTAVVFHGAFTPVVEALRPRMSAVTVWIHADDGTHECPPWAIPYGQAREAADRRCATSWGRSGDDLILIYTGGTTGRPKGVMWRQDDLLRASNGADVPAGVDLEPVRVRVRRRSSPLMGIPAAPLMHGTAFVYATTLLNAGGGAATLVAPGFDAAELLDLIDDQRARSICIVGDAFCRPMVELLEADPGRWSLASLRVISSAGAMWSPTLKRRLHEYIPAATFIDFLNSSEASGMGRLVTVAGSPAETGRFHLGDSALLVDEEGRRVREPGQVGQVAVRGRLPLGYYKDPEATAATFRVVDGERCSIPGDHARLLEDGSIALLGRGSASINTGGEKVYAEEVEQVLKEHPDVRDAVVVGVPDERFGEKVAGVFHSSRPLEVTDLLAFARARLAGYKVPKILIEVPSVERGANGKADLRAIKDYVTAWIRRSRDEAASAGGDTR